MPPYYYLLGMSDFLKIIKTEIYSYILLSIFNNLFEKNLLTMDSDSDILCLEGVSTHNDRVLTSRSDKTLSSGSVWCEKIQ